MRFPGTASGSGQLLRALLNCRCRPDRLNGHDEPLLRFEGRSMFFQEKAASGLLHGVGPNIGAPSARREVVGILDQKRECAQSVHPSSYGEMYLPRKSCAGHASNASASAGVFRYGACWAAAGCRAKSSLQGAQLPTRHPPSDSLGGHSQNYLQALLRAAGSVTNEFPFPCHRTMRSFRVRSQASTGCVFAHAHIIFLSFLLRASL